MSSPAVTAAEIGAFALFRDLPEADRAQLAAAASRRESANGEILYAEGAPATEMFVIEEGQVSLRVQRDGRLIIVGTLGAGEELGWSCLRDEPVELATARATGAARAGRDPRRCPPRAPRRRVARRCGDDAAAPRIAAVHLAAAREQMIRQGREGVITAG